MNKKQKIILLTAIILTAMLFGLKTEICENVEQITFKKGFCPTYLHFTKCYNVKVTPVCSAPTGLASIGVYKYHLMVATLLIGLTLFVAVRKKDRK